MKKKQQQKELFQIQRDATRVNIGAWFRLVPVAIMKYIFLH